MNIESIPVRDIKKLKAVQPRFEINSERVGDFADLLLQNDEFDFPPLTVFRDPLTGELVLADGFTRHGAYLVAERKRVPCDVLDGDEWAASWFALGANMTHGAPLTREERRVVLFKALDHPNRGERTNAQVAEMLGISLKTVERAITERNTENRDKKSKKEKLRFSDEALEAIEKIGQCNEGAKDALLSGTIKKPEDELIAYSELDCPEQLRLAPLFFSRGFNLRDSINLLANRPADAHDRLERFIDYTLMRGCAQAWQFHGDTVEVSITLMRETAPTELVRPSKPKKTAPVQVLEPVEEIL